MKTIDNKTPFTRRVLSIVRAIPKGQVLTYKEVAKKAGKPAASRSVGTIMSKNFDQNIPCHRVIRSDGKLGGYNRGENNKRLILKSEGYLV